jgi:GNAT superfamily N-acetyltransferase
MSVSVRQARAGDGPVLHTLVVALAQHQNEAQLVTATPDALETALCTPQADHGCLIAEADGEPVGFVYWYVAFTTYKAEYKMWMEDLCVLPRARGTGAGLALVKALARICIERDIGRFEWLAMQDNEVGRAFYRKLGGKVRAGADTWQMWRPEIEALAEG